MSIFLQSFPTTITMFGKRIGSRCKAVEDINKYNNEEYENSRLLKFRLSEVKGRRHYTFLKQKAAIEKLKLCRTENPRTLDLCLLPQSYYLTQLKNHVCRIPVPNMHPRIKSKILSFSSKYLKEKFPKVVEVYMADVHEEYSRLMKVYSMKRILQTPPFEHENVEDFDLLQKKFIFKHSGKTALHKYFLENRRRLSKKLLICYPFVRAILAISEKEFPEVIHDFSTKMLPLEATTLSSYFKMLKTDVEKNSQYIRWTWYPKIIGIIKKHFRKRILPLNRWHRVYPCLEGLINRQINNLKERTLNKLLIICGNRRMIPQFKFTLECDDHSGDVELNPSFTTIVETFNLIAFEIANVATKMEPLQPQIDPSLAQYSKEFLRIKMNEIYLEEYLHILKETLTRTYLPIKNYVRWYKEKYFNLYSSEMTINLENFLNEPREFHEYFNKIEYYSEYINQLRSEPYQECFENGLINSYQATRKLQEIAEMHIEKISQEAVLKHINTEKAICNTFEYIKREALSIPLSTEELLNGAEQMIYIKNVKLEELRTEIQGCLRIGTDLASFTELSKHQTDQTVETISWLHEINSVFELNASQHEQYKFLFEEHLQEVTKKLNSDVLQLIPKLTLINDMSESDKFRSNHILLQNIMDQLKSFDEYVQWINKEEKLLKLPQTRYPILEVLKDFIFPFAALMKYVHNFFNLHKSLIPCSFFL